MSNLYKVSVIIPVYNSAKTIEKSLASIQEQSLKEIEIIVVNDASEDSTGEILDRLAKNDTRLKVIHSQSNQGVYKARAKGIEIATAKWIGFLDADDFAKPEMFLRMLTVANREGVDIVICESDRVNFERRKISTKVRFHKSMKVTNSIFEKFCNFEFGTGAHWNKLYKAELIKKWGAIEHSLRQDTNEDVLVNIGVFHEAKSVYLLKKVLHEYTYNEQSVTSTLDQSNAYYSIIKAYFLALLIYKKFDTQAFRQITELYRRQLEWPDYTPEELILSEEQISKLLTLMSEAIKIYPYSMIYLPCRRQKRRCRFFDLKLPSFVIKMIKKYV